MSWLAKSLANSLIPDPVDGVAGEGTGDGDRKPGNEESPKFEARTGQEEEIEPPVEPGTPSRGVKEDLSELTQTLTRQFWGVASFLAPPPTPPRSISSSADASPSYCGRPPDPTFADGSDQEEAPESPRIARMRSDFADIGGRFRSGISRLSNNAAVSEIGKMASNFLPFGSEEEEEEDDRAIGVTEEVMAFARNIAMHPETWLDFPLFPEFEDCDDFEMSNSQQEHGWAVESLEPRFAALRIELCPSHMTEGCFWKIYFVLLHSRLNKHDAELLSTPQIAEARAMLLQKLQNRTKPELQTSNQGLKYRNADVTSISSRDHRDHVVASPSDALTETSPSNAYSFEDPMTCVPVSDSETEQHKVHPTEAKFVDKSVTEEGSGIQPNSKDFLSSFSEISIQRGDDDYDDDDGDDWFEEADVGASGRTTIPLEHEDVSFSDLEEDDEPSLLSNSTPKTAASVAKDLSHRVQSNKSSDRWQSH